MVDDVLFPHTVGIKKPAYAGSTFRNTYHQIRNESRVVVSTVPEET